MKPNTARDNRSNYRDEWDTGIKLEAGKLYCTGEGETVRILRRSKEPVDGAVNETWEGSDGSWWHTNGTLGYFEDVPHHYDDYHIVCECDDVELEET